jgi:hypothetical protein
VSPNDSLGARKADDYHCPRGPGTQVGPELTGLLEDSSVLFGILAAIEALRFELLELRQIPTEPKSP